MKTYHQAQTKLQPAEFMLYSAIFNTIQFTGENFTMTTPEIADTYQGLNETSIKRSLKVLIDEGYVTVKRGTKVNLNGQITILNGEPYRTIIPTDKVTPTKNAKKKDNKESLERFDKFWSDKVKKENKKGKENAKRAWVKLSIEEQRLAYKM